MKTLLSKPLAFNGLAKKVKVETDENKSPNVKRGVYGGYR